MFYGFILSLYNFNFNFNGVELKVYLPYFTNQTYICINIYFALTIYFHLKDNKNELPKKFKNDFVNVLLHFFLNILPPLALLVTLVFWTLIAPILDWSLYNHWNVQLHFLQHLFQSIFIIPDWYLMNVPSSLNIAIPNTAIGIIFLIFAHIYHHFTGNWIYDFLDTSNKIWPIIYVCVVAFWTVFGFVFAKVHVMKYESRTKKSTEESQKNSKKGK